MRYFTSVWESLWFIVVILIVLGLICFSFSEKENKGYYLHHDDSCYKICINWDNAPDSTAFRTYDKQEVLRVFKELQDSYNKNHRKD